MPTTSATSVKAYAHCRDARCPGYTQTEVDAIREDVNQTYGENGGDGIFVNFVERSWVEYKFADAEDAPCFTCGVPREVTGSPRPSYQPLSGHDPLGLLNTPRFDATPSAGASVPAAARGESDEEIEYRLRAKLREEQLEAKLRKELGE